MTKLLDKSAIDEVCELLLKGEVVAFPTDTVYGIGIRYDDKAAIERMKQAKKRPENKPFPLMVADFRQMKEVAEVNETIEKIAENFMPGALTLVLNKKSVIDDEATFGKKTIAIRIPDDEFVLELLAKVGPMFVTSANLSGEPSCNNDAEVMEQLAGRIGAVVKGEAYSHTASTIIDCTGSELKCLREGQLSLEMITRKIG